MGYPVATANPATPTITNWLEQSICAENTTAFTVTVCTIKHSTFPWNALRIATYQPVQPSISAKSDCYLPSPTASFPATAEAGQPAACQAQCFTSLGRRTGYFRQHRRFAHSGSTYRAGSLCKFCWSRHGSSSRRSDRHQPILLTASYRVWTDARRVWATSSCPDWACWWFWRWFRATKQQPFWRKTCRAAGRESH